MKVVDGFCRSDDFVSLLNQYQSQFVGVLDDESVNDTDNGVIPETVLVENAATGAATAAVTVIYDVLFSQSPPAVFEAYNLTLYVPVVNVVVGFCKSDDFVSFAYQYQSQFVGVLVLESVNPIDNGVVPEVTFAANTLIGADMGGSPPLHVVFVNKS